MGRESMARPGKGCLGVLGLLALAAGALIGVEVGCRVLEAPWLFGAGGRPTLTGTWEGARHARLGTEYRLYVDLAYASSSADSNRYGLSDQHLQARVRRSAVAAHADGRGSASTCVMTGSRKTSRPATRLSTIVGTVHASSNARATIRTTSKPPPPAARTAQIAIVSHVGPMHR